MHSQPLTINPIINLGRFNQTATSKLPLEQLDVDDDPISSPLPKGKQN